MEIEIKTWLYDILNAIVEIDSFFSDTPKTLISFQNDLRTRRTVGSTGTIRRIKNTINGLSILHKIPASFVTLAGGHFHNITAPLSCCFLLLPLCIIL